MLEKRYVQPIRLAKLSDELAAAGLAPVSVLGEGWTEATNQHTAVTIQVEAAEAAVDAVVGAHDAGTPPAGEQAQTDNQAAVRDFRESADLMLDQCDVYRAHMDQIVLDMQTATTVNQVARGVRDIAQDFRAFLGDHKKFIRGVEAQGELAGGPLELPP